MLSQLSTLSVKTEGRYATDDELQFIVLYAKSYALRLETYQTLQAIEALVVQQVQVKLKRIAPHLFHHGLNDLTVKWKQDTLRVMRYSAIALLLNDPETLRERFLLWFQSIMRAYGTQPSCGMTYKVMQDVVSQHLTPEQSSLFLPILELNRQLLGDPTQYHPTQYP